MDIDEISEHAADYVSADLKRRSEEFLGLLKAAHPERWEALLRLQRSHEPQP